MTEKNETVTDPSHECRHDEHCCYLVLETPPPKPKRTKNSPQFDPLPSLPVLPHEIIEEILSRLPVKTLIRFRCVSKSFKTLISDPHFIRSHLRKIKSSPNKPNLHQNFVLNWSGTRTLLKTCSLYSIFNNSQADVVDFVDYSLMTGGYYHWAVGTCDGLLCLARKREFVIVANPSTRVINRLPDLGFGNKFGRVQYGFGYDRKTNDYKVVALSSREEGRKYETVVKVCSLRSRCWRMIENFPYAVPYYSGKYLSGSLIWEVMHKSGSRFMWTIVSFDLASETCEEVKQPDYGEVSMYDKRLEVLDGCLCVMCDYFPSHADIWVIKEHGVGDSWTKLVSIPYLDNPARSFFTGPYYIADNGEVLVKLRSAFLVYNPKDGTRRYPLIRGSLDNFWVAEGTYIESLVSPVPDNQRLLTTRRSTYIRWIETTVS